MPEILTESFCERCGTRYTFESAAPRKTRRLGQFKTLSKGLKNYVMSDDTSMDEAMAAARGDEEREVTAQQLDAFHSTFNFCMNCRQYTCGNCWNQAEGRCLTCAPHLGQDVLPGPFADDVPFEQVPISADAWPTADLQADQTPLETILATHGKNGGNGADAPVFEPEPSTEVAAELEEELEEIDLGARLSFLISDRPKDETAKPVEAAAPEAAAPEAPPAEVVADAAPESVGPVAADSLPETLDEQASTLADHTSVLLGRFRPGQNIDAELEAYEARLADEDAVEPEPVTAEAAPEPAVEAVVVEPADAEPLAAEAPIAEPVAASAPEPEPLAAAVAEPEEPEPLAAAAQADVEPLAAEPEPAREDRIEQPTWRIFAPDQSGPAQQPTAPPVEPVVPVTPPAPPAVQASVEPQWPTQPDWQESPSMALLANRDRASSDALWAASSQEVLRPPVGPATQVAGVQPCSNCGLSLSATARFCRRCGSRQA